MSCAGRRMRTGEYLVIRKGDGGFVQAGIGGNSNIYAAERSGSGVFGRTIGCHKGDVEIPLARTGTGVVVDFDLCGDVSTVSWHEAACGGESRGVDSFTGTGEIGATSIVGALHLDVESGQVVVADVHRGRIIGCIVPHAVVAGD